MEIKTDAAAGHITHHTLQRNSMMPRMQTLWTCSVLIVILFTESHCIQKTTLTKNWGPQSMLYLKGKYGRRYVPDSGVDFYKSALKSWYAVIRDEVSANWKIDSSFHGRESADPLHRVGSIYAAEYIQKL
ncbi:spexin prohormone 2-like isoform X2 [Tachysurus vachellii]|uniref:spexin prohormone 2-like isoform X2 n=1 Tax=Tachysurus vachellii TaxID=175792 RepID=UPI00296ADDA0|nr:spexin prohormone 2-like isoform X2 [Tachysurus vachellii]